MEGRVSVCFFVSGIRVSGNSVAMGNVQCFLHPGVVFYYISFFYDKAYLDKARSFARIYDAFVHIWARVNCEFGVFSIKWTPASFTVHLSTKLWLVFAKALHSPSSFRCSARL